MKKKIYQTVEFVIYYGSNTADILSASEPVIPGSGDANDVAWIPEGGLS